MSDGRGWSTSVGELRKAIADMPDDYEVVIDNCEAEDCEISAVFVYQQFPPALNVAGLLVLRGGQQITSEYEYHPRLDVSLDYSGATIRWKELTQEWERS